MPDNNNEIFSIFRGANQSTDENEKDSSSLPYSEVPSPKLSKAKHKWLRRMTLEVNKFPYSHTKTLGLYSFDRDELEWFYKEIRLLVDKALDILECPVCEDTIKKAAMPGCGCENPLVCCSTCWWEAGGICLNCRKTCTSLPFEPVDEIIRECHLFLQEKAFKTDMKVGEKSLKRLGESYHHFLKQSEIQLMCDYCFGTLDNTTTIDFGNGMLTQTCKGCHELYMECYKSCQNFSPYPTFDKLNTEFCHFFSKVLAYCVSNKTQLYKDPYPDSKQPSWLRQRVMRRGYKRRWLGIFRNAVVVAACAYAVTYFVQ